MSHPGEHVNTILSVPGIIFLFGLLCCLPADAGEMFVLKTCMVGPLSTNCYILKNQRTQSVLIIDPGAGFDKIDQTIRNIGGKVVAVLLTHGHEDHLGAVHEALEKYPCPVFLHRDDRSMAQSSGVNPSSEVRDGESLEFEGFKLQVLGFPGHSPGSVAFLLDSTAQDEEDKLPDRDETWLFAGDTVFGGGVGRTWARSDEVRMLEGIREKVLPLHDKTVVFPGHGPSELLGRVKPWLNRYINERLGR